ncbi:iron-sulfur cluster binding protein, putative [Synechococcus sp. PCC 7502]|uniref:tRNA epoxyqueuosine(34) reductase QueG n=1 Tax=Synechococcus sp. PCC 7502 TaxID=1173263 RepID=UPI00029FA0AC|nr:tRNA epoxyqueuosine(34) reductase QueG [Synechococcus sp. PCC 7502]AFY72290.1 iron-sulfur cluster binding protein, putative [Synechococcus sp. PCC 7502]
MVQSADIKQKAYEIGFDLVGIAIADLESYPEADRLKSWLALGYHADMAWMENPKRLNIKELMPSVESVICVGLNYYTSNTHSNIHVDDPAIAKISRYGWGRDYHRILGKKLKILSHWLQSQGEDIETRYYVDTAPIAEKAWAQRAGIGWIGKHSNLISRGYGSWIFLGEILTNIELEPDQPHTEHCGTCTRCLDACPTGAIAQPFVVDANRCIAYHTIENKSEALPENINLNNWVAGCDICQDVCPWNHRFAQETKVQEFQPYPQNTVPNLADLAKITDQEWDKNFTGSALRRIKPDRLRRNAKAAMTAFMAKLE